MSLADDLLVVVRHPLVRLMLAVMALASPAAAQECSHPKDWSFYSHGDFTVRVVRIESPIDFLHAVARTLDAIKPTLPLQPGSVFSATRASEGRAIIHERLVAADKDLEQSFRLLVVIGRIENCVETGSARQLDLVYSAFTTNYNAYLSHSIELKQSEIERPATTAATSNATGSLLVKPFFGYNRTSQLFGGAQATARMPAGIFDFLRLAAAGSTSANVEELELVGSRAPGFLSSLEYRLGYKHSDIPAGNNRLREGKLRAQLSGSTQPLGSGKVVVRFGASLEGGNLQSAQDPGGGAGIVVQSSGYGALKAYIGATGSAGRYSFSGSYGLQAGTLGASTSVAFVKHVVDLSSTASFLPKETTGAGFHKPLNIEARVAGGLIQRLDKVPVAERFFGGNETQNFIAGDTWQIRGGPFIRSIPQNRLNGTNTAAPVGGSSFYSVNLTFSRPVWGRPIIPKEMAEDPEFFPAVEAAKATARQALIATRKNGLPAFTRVIDHLSTLNPDLKQIDAIVKAVPSDAPEDLADAAADVQDDLAIIGEILNDQSTLPSKLDGFIKVDRSTITKLLEHLDSLSEALNDAGQTVPGGQIKIARDSLATKKASFVAELNQVDFSEATRLADQDMQSIDSVLRTFLHELNLVSVSPVAIFDAARIWPDRFGTRYGIGGGVRLSLVNFNVTLGYAVNPTPRLQEGRGAFFFSMDVTDLFR
ncbi:MAG: hypothetical protein AABO41_02010 [Acidobacteriota bacterium]